MPLWGGCNSKIHSFSFSAFFVVIFEIAYLCHSERLKKSAKQSSANLKQKYHNILGKQARTINNNQKAGQTSLSSNNWKKTFESTIEHSLYHLTFSCSFIFLGFSLLYIKNKSWRMLHRLYLHDLQNSPTFSCKFLLEQTIHLHCCDHAF